MLYRLDNFGNPEIAENCYDGVEEARPQPGGEASANAGNLLHEEGVFPPQRARENRAEGEGNHVPVGEGCSSVAG